MVSLTQILSWRHLQWRQEACCSSWNRQKEKCGCTKSRGDIWKTVPLDIEYLQTLSKRPAGTVSHPTLAFWIHLCGSSGACMQFGIDHFLAGLTLGKLLDNSTKLMRNTCEGHRTWIRVSSQAAALELIYYLVTAGQELRQTLGCGRDREARCATVPGLSKSWTRLGELLRPTSYAGLF